VKNYFLLTNTQLVGIATWTIVILMMIVLLHVNFQNNPPNPFQVDKSDLQFVQLNAEKESQNFSFNNQSGWQKDEIDLAEFDPNTITKKEWQNLGFSEKQADVIVNYRTNKGPFKSKQDLKKIYVISDEKYKELEPFIVIQNILVESKNEILIELNSASQDTLESLPLIGPGFAKNIIKLRNSLGGFTSMTQLHEVYNMSEEIYQILLENTTLNLSSVKTININSDSKETIDKHPYITWEMTAEILKKRDQEKIKNLDFLVEKNLLTNLDKQKLEPYIRYE